jgi:chemotaxis protein CheX
MSIKVALIDFPRLQEQIAGRILSEQNIQSKGLTYHDAAEKLSEYHLALYYIPENSRDTVKRLEEVEQSNLQAKIPLLLVATDSAKKRAQEELRLNGNYEYLHTPLQPQLMASKIRWLLGVEEQASPAASLDVRHVNPFMTGTINTLKQMAQMECVRTNLEVHSDARTRADISGVMALAGKIEGFVAISCSSKLAQTMVCRMLELKPGEETEEDLIDGFGEVMNIIAGAAKAELVNTDHAFQLSIPNVIIGGPHSLGQPRSGTPVVVICFVAEGEPLELMIYMRRSRD